MTTVTSTIIIGSTGNRMFEEPERASAKRLLSDTTSLASAALTLFVNIQEGHDREQQAVP